MAEPSYRLPFHVRLSYGVGHVFNDLCAAMWFCYLLVFFHNVINFSNSLAGYVMLLGQIADAICTPFVGIESDRTRGLCNYGQRKSWHLVGTISVICSFPFLFNECIGCGHSAQWAQFIYYAPFVVIFQCAWASVQISHLSLIPSLTANESERVELNAIRYAFTVVASIMVYVTAWLLFHVGSAHDNANLSSADLPEFRNLAFIVVGVGAVFSLIFHLGTRERPASQSGSVSAHTSPTGQLHMSWRKWLKEHQFYQVALMYMCTRLIVNLTQVYIPMYLTDTLDLDKEHIATVPLVVFLSGFLTSFLMKPVNKILGRKATYLLGALLVIGSCVWMWYINDKTALQVFGGAVFLGAGASTTLVTSLAMTADLIGNHVETGAFVYGAMSFTDKLSNGVAVLIIQQMHPCKSPVCCPACTWYYRDVMVLVPGGIACVAILILLTLVPQKLGCLRHHSTTAIQHQDTEADKQGLLPSDTNEEDCCNYGLCYSTDTDAQAKGITPDTSTKSGSPGACSPSTTTAPLLACTDEPTPRASINYGSTEVHPQGTANSHHTGVSTRA